MVSRRVRLPRGSLQEALAVFVLMFVVSGVLYGQILNNYFLNDDFGRILTVRGLQHLGPAEALISIFTEPLLSYYRPFTFLSFYLLIEAFGLNVVYYYLSAIILHVLSSFVVYLLLRKLADETASQRTWVALIATLLFVVHPRQVESVSYIHDNENTICGLFFFIGLLCFLDYCRTERLRYLFCSCASYLFSLLGKEMGVTLPLICLAYFLIFHLGTRTLRSLFQDNIVRRSTLAFGITFLVYMLMRWHALGVLIGGAGDTAQLAFSLTRMARTFVQAGIAMVVPNDLPGMEALADFFRVRVVLFLLFTLGIGGVVFWQLLKLRSKVFWFGFVWCVVSLLPILNNGIGVHELTGGRYLYITIAGFSLCLADLVMRFRSRRRTALVTGLVLILLSGCTYRNNMMMVYASRISEGFLKGLGEAVAHTRDESIVVLVPRMFKGVYMLNGIGGGITLLYGTEGLGLLKRAQELSLQIDREGEVSVDVSKAGEQGLVISLGKGAGFLWSEQFYDVHTVKTLNLRFSEIRTLNTKGDFVAQVAQLAPVDAIIIPDFLHPDSHADIIRTTYSTP